jgi:hypothetical protein
MWRSNQFKWTEIAFQLGWSLSTLYRWRTSNNFIEPMFTPSTDIIKEIISLYIMEYGYRGENSTMGHLRGVHHIWIRVTDLRKIIIEINQEGRQLRRSKVIKRRIYYAIRPGHIWHIDTHQKIGLDGFITVGVICGYSHQIIALSCHTDYKAKTLLTALFDSPGMREHGLPELIRVDHGLENIAIGRLINSVNGPNHFIMGKSVHNQRIER